MPDRELVAQIADEVDALVPIFGEIARRFREQVDVELSPEACALLYGFRSHITPLINRLGSGTPYNVLEVWNSVAKSVGARNGSHT